MPDQFKERDWNRLISIIKEERVIPVVGPELLVISMDGERVSLYDHIAKALAKRLQIPADFLPDEYTLNDVAQAFLTMTDSDPEDIYYETHEIISERTWPTPEPLKKIAGIHHFKLFLSVTFDPLLRQAIDEVRYGGAAKTRQLSYSPRRPIEDLPVQIECGERTYLYQLFGTASATQDYAITEDDILHFTHRLQSSSKRPKNLFDHLKEKQLLTLGCSFPDWLTRFFFSAIKSEWLFSDRGIRGIVADERSPQKKMLREFLQRKRAGLYPEGDGAGFIEALYDRWSARFPHHGGEQTGRVPTKEVEGLLRSEPDAVFISYASEDRDAVFNLKNALEESGIPVWFDQARLEAGDNWRDQILENILNCSVFIPIISVNTIRLEPRVFHYEWREAIDRSKDYPETWSFIRPVAIDRTQADAPNIPKAFRTLHWKWFKEGRPTPEFVEKIKQSIRELRKRRRN